MIAVQPILVLSTQVLPGASAFIDCDDAPTDEQGRPGGAMWHAVWLAVNYAEGAPGGRARVRVQWLPDSFGLFPAPGVVEPTVTPTIDLPTGTGDYIVSVAAPGGALRRVRFGLAEIGVPGTPGIVQAFVGGSMVSA